MTQEPTREPVPDPEDPRRDGPEETVAFALDGEHYEIDLSAERAAALRAALAVYVARARRVRRRPAHLDEPAASGSDRPRGAGGSSGTGAAEQNRAIREWARRQGTPLGGRGRIPSALVEAYHQDRRRIVHTKFSPLATAVAQYRWTH